MCGRFCIAADPGEISERYGVEVPPEYKPRYNISPSQPILTITKSLNTFEAHMIGWGFQSGTMQRIINARVETIHEKPLFKHLFPDHRCLIPASGYYEWKNNGDLKIPYYFSSESGSLISFAGLIRPSSHGDQVVILTTRAPPPYSGIHDRMPVILDSVHEVTFLSDGDITGTHALRMFEVSPRVNQTNLDYPDLVKPWKYIPEQKTLADIL